MPTAVGLLERLDEVEGLVVVTVGDKKPAWLPERLHDMVLTPADAKGLEYQSVCVLDPGRVLAQLEAAAGSMAIGTSQALQEQEHRTAIDQLRVALSRATETLAFVDVDGDDDAHALSAQLLEDAAPYRGDDLVEHFADDAPPDERVQARTKGARGLIDTAPGRAWQRACQAMRLLGDPQLPNGVADESVRVEARTTLLATAARLLVDGVPDAVRRDEVVSMAGAAIVPLRASDRYAQALQALDAWTQAPEVAPFAPLDATLALDSDGSWLRQALPPVAQQLRGAIETFAGDPPTAAAYAGDIEGWLKLTGYAGDAATTARALRCRAVDTLTDAGQVLAAAEVLDAVRPPDLGRLGRLREVQGRLQDAAKTFEAANMPADALRNWRAAGKWEQAVRLAEGQERRNLDWLVELEALVRRQPADARTCLTAAERHRLVQILNTVEPLPRSGRTPPPGRRFH